MIKLINARRREIKRNESKYLYLIHFRRDSTISISHYHLSTYIRFSWRICIYLLKCRTIDAWMDSNNRHFSLYREKRNYLSKHSWVATFLGLLFGQRYISNLPKWFAVSSISTSISCKFERYRCDVKEKEKLKGKKNWWNGLFFVIVRLLWRKKKF